MNNFRGDLTDVSDETKMSLAQKCQNASSFADDILNTSPQNLFILIMKTNIVRVHVSREIFIFSLNTKSLVSLSPQRSFPLSYRFFLIQSAERAPGAELSQNSAWCSQCFCFGSRMLSTEAPPLGSTRLSKKMKQALDSHLNRPMPLRKRRTVVNYTIGPGSGTIEGSSTLECSRRDHVTARPPFKGAIVFNSTLNSETNSR